MHVFVGHEIVTPIHTEALRFYLDANGVTQQDK
jgi:hypothetical protein